MPVFRRCNDDRIDGLIFQDLAQVSYSLWSGALCFFHYCGSPSGAGILRIANVRHMYVWPLAESLDKHGSAAARADEGEGDLVIWGGVCPQTNHFRCKRGGGSRG